MYRAFKLKMGERNFSTAPHPPQANGGISLPDKDHVAR